MSATTTEQLIGPWIGYGAASEHTGLSGSYLRKLVMTGDVPHRKVGRRVLFSLSELDAWVNENGRMDAAAVQGAGQ